MLNLSISHSTAIQYMMIPLAHLSKPTLTDKQKQITLRATS